MVEARRAAAGRRPVATEGREIGALPPGAPSLMFQGVLNHQIMAEYWQDVNERAQATIAVWQQHFADLVLGTTDLVAFQALATAMPDHAQTRDTQAS